jgi:hypothetical protein
LLQDSSCGPPSGRSDYPAELNTKLARPAGIVRRDRIVGELNVSEKIYSSMENFFLTRAARVTILANISKSVENRTERTGNRTPLRGSA